MSRIFLRDRKPLNILPMTSFYFRSKDDALNELRRSYSRVYSGRTPVGFCEEYGSLIYSEKKTVGIFRKREKEEEDQDDTISIQDFDNGVLLHITIFDGSECDTDNLKLALLLEERR